MSREVSNTLRYHLYAQESEDPFLQLFTFTHESFSTIRLVNNMTDVVSRGLTFTAFPIQVTMPTDDGDTAREVVLEMDNASLFMMEALRSVRTPIQVKIEMILASVPDTVQIELAELEINNVTYNATSIQARLILDGFLTTSIPAETYGPTNFPGIF